MIFTCTCGKRYEVREIMDNHSPVDPFAHGWKPMSAMPDSSRSLRKLGDVAQVPAPVPSFSEARRTSPARAASVESDVAVPLFQSAITSGVVLIGSGVIVAAAGWPWYVAPMACGAAFVISWAVLLADHRSLLRVVEVIVNRDLDNDNQIGPKQEWRVTGEIKHEHGDRPASMSLFDLPCPSPDDLRAFARGILGGSATFSETSAAKHNYTAAMWDNLREDFINREWAYWKHPTERRQGLALTAAGRAVVRAIADAPLP